MFRLGFGRGQRDRQGGRQALTGAPPPALDLAALKQEEARRTADSLAALERGQLPPHVAERLRSQERGELPWTSDLSVNEWAALRRFRLRPLGQVMGSAFYHMGYVYVPGFSFISQELAGPTRAMTEGRRLAVSRMAQEAALLGANAVVGVHLSGRRLEFAEGLWEYRAFGTAVRVEGLPESPAPLLCTVSGQDFARLLSGGALPVNIAMGASFYYLATDWWDMRQQLSWYNQEMTHYQRGLQEARRLASRGLRQDLQRAGGTGVVGVEVEVAVEEIRSRRTQEGEEIEDHLISAFMLGTVIETVGPAHTSGTFVHVLDLRR
jgi:uncharacterized protein YbjQ (UPF0145 family)